MTTTIPDALLSRLSQLIDAQMGLHFARERWPELERGIKSAAPELGFEDTEACIKGLLLSSLTKEQIKILASHITVGETYFFRNKGIFTAFEAHILPALIQARWAGDRHLKIWSAGCCTGEEPYSIAILLHKMITELHNWHITILATDINPRFLQKATEGIYRPWSFRGTPEWVKENYFKQTPDGHFEVLPHIKQMVTFSYLNLIEDDYPSILNNTHTLDVIFCRNVLIYFASETIQKIIERYYRSLADGGWLVVSSSETSLLMQSQLVPANFPGAILYRKDEQQSRSKEGFTITSPFTETKTWQTTTAPGAATGNLPDAETQGEAIVDVQSVPTELATKEYLPQTFDVKPAKQPAPQQVSPYETALALYEQGHYTAVAEALEDLFAPDHHLDPGTLPPEEKAMLLFTRAYANQGQLDKAEVWCKKAIAADRLNPIYHYLLATIFQEQDQLDQAIKSLKRALYLNRDFVLAHFAIGNLTRKQGKFSEANKHFDNALGLLQKWSPETILPESEGLTAGRLKELITLLRT